MARWVAVVASVLVSALLTTGAAHTAGEATPSARVGAFYFDGWSGDMDDFYKGAFHWGGMIGTQHSGRRPLSGWRDAAPEAIEAQLRWARRAGLSFFVFDWFHKPDPGNGPLNMALDTYWKLEDRAGIQAAIAYTNQGPVVVPRHEWEETVESWVTRYFLQPDYVRIDGRPLLVILDEAGFIRQSGGGAGANAAIETLRSTARRHGLPGVFVVGGRYVDYWSERCFPQCIDTDSAFSSVDYDALVEYSYPKIVEPRDGPRPYADAAGAMRRLWDVVAARSPFPHIPSVMTGFDARPMVLDGQIQRPEEGGWPLMDGRETWFVRTPADVGSFVRDAVAWVNAHPGMRVEPGPPVVVLGSWNELQEGAYIVPTDADGYGYLQAIAEALGVPWIPPPKRTLRVAPSPRGAVTSSPPGISCPPRCEASFDEGWQVTLTAGARPASIFDGWRNCPELEKDGSCSVVLVRDTRSTPQFTERRQRRALTLSVAAGVAKGRLSALDGYLPCRSAKIVDVQHRRGGHWVSVTSALTVASGRFSASLPKRSGDFRVVVHRDSANGRTCLVATSPIRTARS